MTLHPIPLNFLIYEKNYLFYFISAVINVCVSKCMNLRLCAQLLASINEYIYPRVQRF
jgi:hypothetical protein